MDDLNQQQDSQEPVQPKHDVPLEQPHDQETAQDPQQAPQPEADSSSQQEQSPPPLTDEEEKPPSDEMSKLMEGRPSIPPKEEPKEAATGETVVKESKRSLVNVIIALLVLALIAGGVYLYVMYRGEFGLFKEKSGGEREGSMVEESTESLDELDSVFDKLNSDLEDVESEMSEEAELERDLEL